MRICPECRQEALRHFENKTFECQYCTAFIVHEGNGFVVEKD